MFIKKLIAILLLVIFSSAVIAQTVCDGKPVFGEIEKVKLMENNLTLDAKLDTGAAMSSLSAQDVTVFKRDNQLLTHFVIPLPNTQQKINFTLPVVNYVKIKIRKEENNDHAYTMRPVVRLTACLGKNKSTILVNLTDRTDFNYPLLIGIEALKNFNVLVDVSQKYSTLPICQN